MANLTSEDLWGGIHDIGNEDGTADNLPPVVVAALIELGFVTLSTAGIPLLTEAGQQAYVVMELGDGEVPELDNYGH
jgi:hypothetical protein